MPPSPYASSTTRLFPRAFSSVFAGGQTPSTAQVSANVASRTLFHALGMSAACVCDQSSASMASRSVGARDSVHGSACCARETEETAAAASSHAATEGSRHSSPSPSSPSRTSSAPMSRVL